MNAPYATASLYVGDLEPNCTESMLFDTFKKVGTVSSIRVCRDAATRRSLGYAYVNFHNTADAERAIDTLNYTAIGGGPKPCRIMWSHRDPALRRSGKGNLFIKNLDASIDHKALCDTFSAFGNILSCKVSQDKQGKSKGFGFVHYEEPEAAQAAIEQVNGMLLCGKKVFVGLFLPRKQRGDGEGSAKFTNVYVKDIAESVTDADLTELCEKYGKVTSVHIVKGEEGVSKGFGFVNFDDFEQARACVEGLNGTEIDGKTLFVARAQKKEERENQLKAQFEERKNRYAESNLYVKNIDETIKEDELRKEFEPFGEVISCKIMLDVAGASKGFGFVCFSTPEEAHKSIAEKNNSMLRGKPLYVALAQRKEVRVAQLSAQHAHRGGGGRGMGMPNPMFQGGYPMMNAQQQRFVQGVQGPYPPMGGQQVRPPRWVNNGNNRGNMGNSQGGYKGRNPRQNNRHNNNNNNTRPQGQGNMPQQGYVLQQGQKTGVPAQIPVEQVNQGQAEGTNPPNQSLADLSEKDRKHVLGEFLYPKIEDLLTKEGQGDGQETGKITGMLLESLDHGELVHLLESPTELQSRVEEAINVLREHIAASTTEKPQ